MSDYGSPTPVAVFIAIVVAIPTAAWALSVEDVPNPQDQGRWVTDSADMLSPSAERELDGRIDALEQDLGVEIAVVTVDEVDAPTPKDFATSLFNHWGIGKASSDNGLLVLMVRGERRLEMETGYGMEAVLTDGWLKRMQQEEMVPHFKGGDFGKGLRAGLAACDERLRKYPEGIGDGASSFEAPEERGGSWGWLFVGLVLGGGAAVGGGVWYKRRRESICPECETQMNLLPETEEDEHLEAGQETEEVVGSVEYRVYECEECEFDRVVRDAAWFSWFERCPACNYRTLGTDTETIRAATTTSTGRKRITKECSHCDHFDSFTRTIPRKTSSSSSSSSSFSSGGGSSGGFGGGSSGGGGAGSSW